MSTALIAEGISRNTPIICKSRRYQPTNRRKTLLPSTSTTEYLYQLAAVVCFVSTKRKESSCKGKIRGNQRLGALNAGETTMPEDSMLGGMACIIALNFIYFVNVILKNQFLQLVSNYTLHYILKTRWANQSV